MSKRLSDCAYLRQLQSLITTLSTYKKTSKRLESLRLERDLLVAKVIKERLC